MTIDEIFKQIATHMIDGLMFHSEMSFYYHFLNLKGYRECHEYHYLCESKNYMDLCKYYMNNYNKLLRIESQFDTIIPQSWYQYTQQQVDTSTKRNAVKTALEKWIDWEQETISLYKKMYQELLNLQDFNAAKQIMCYILDATEERNYARHKYLTLKSVDYDIAYMAAEQDCLKEKYCHKKSKIYKTKKWD